MNQTEYEAVVVQDLSAPDVGEGEVAVTGSMDLDDGDWACIGTKGTKTFVHCWVAGRCNFRVWDEGVTPSDAEINETLRSIRRIA